MLGHVGVGHGVAFKAAGLRLDTDVGHGLVRGAFEVAVAAGRHADDGALGDVEDLVVHLEPACAREDDVVLLIGPVAVEERDCRIRGQRAERDLAGGSPCSFLYELFALETFEGPD